MQESVDRSGQAQEQSGWRRTAQQVRGPLSVLAYFAVLALIIAPVRQHGATTEQLFFLIIGTGAGFWLFLQLLKLLFRRRRGHAGLTKEDQREWRSGRAMRAYAQEMQATPLGTTSLIAVDAAVLERRSGSRAEEEEPDRDLVLPEQVEEAEPTLQISASMPAAPALAPPVPVPLLTVAQPKEALAGDELPVIEPDPLLLADDFRPGVHSFIGQMALIIGIRRSGKSNLFACFFESLAVYGFPFVLFDTEDEYSGLVDPQYLTHGVQVGSLDLLREEPGLRQRKRYTPVDAEHAYAFGQAVMDGLLQAVVNLKSYDPETAATVMAGIVRGIHDWQDARPNRERVPVIVGLDEAQYWLPQDLGDSVLSSARQRALHHAWFDQVVARGGKRGFTIIISTQRYSQINKRLLQANWKFFLAQKEDADLDRYKAMGVPREQALTLRRGEGFVFTETVTARRVRFRLRWSPHEGKTPGMENLLAYREQAASIADVLSRSYTGRAAGYGDVPPLPSEPSRNAYETPAPPPARQVEPTPPSSPSPPRKPPLSREQQVALELFLKGNTKVAQLQAAMNQDERVREYGTISQTRAYELLCALDAAGLITRAKKRTPLPAQ